MWKNGSHTIRSATLENPMLHANFISLCVTELELLPMEVLIAGIGLLDLYCCCDLDLDFDLMTIIYKLDPYSLDIYRMCEYELQVIVWHTYIHTDTPEIIHHAALQVVNKCTQWTELTNDERYVAHLVKQNLSVHIRIRLNVFLQLYHDTDSSETVI